eukprot:23692-Chlamydomonas_euryale.AAC.9
MERGQPCGCSVECLCGRCCACCLSLSVMARVTPSRARGGALADEWVRLQSRKGLIRGLTHVHGLMHHRSAGTR